MLLFLFDPVITDEDIKQIINKVNSSDNITNLKKLYQNELTQFKEVTNKDIKNEIQKDNYKGSIIDLPLLAKLLKINIIVLYSRITKANPNAFNVFLCSMPDDVPYLILYSFKEK